MAYLNGWIIFWLYMIICFISQSYSNKTHVGTRTRVDGRATLKPSRLNINATRYALATPPTAFVTFNKTASRVNGSLHNNNVNSNSKTAGRDNGNHEGDVTYTTCKCRPEEFTCSSSPFSFPNNNGRRKGQLPFNMKKGNTSSSGVISGGSGGGSRSSGGGGGEDGGAVSNQNKDPDVVVVQQCACIPQSWVCDGNQDCDNGEDEHHCGDTGCIGIRCPGLRSRSGTRCIQSEWLCDGDNDCGDNSDEMNCDTNQNCTGLFHCDNGLCIPQHWVCDGDADCEGASDERNCQQFFTRTCQPTQLRCGDGSCIPSEWKCDGDPDCPDMSDEIGCDSAEPECSPEEFQCASGQCVKSVFRCDGDIQCRDGSDELNCGSDAPACKEGEFRCPGGFCILQTWKCDGEADCEPGVDEENCEGLIINSCDPRQTACSSKGGCISSSWVCDGEKDCYHGEDEMNCPTWCGKDQFACSNDSCIGFQHVCNGEKDCPNGEDENDCTIQTKCEAGSRCQHTCVVMLNGTAACACRSGYKLNNDGFTCSDVDECSLETVYCSQLCTNTAGGFSCNCVEGYRLRPDGTSCKANGQPARLIFANRVDIREVSLFDEEYTSVIDGLQNAIALDFHYSKGIVVWSDISLDAIKRAYFNGTGMTDIIWWGLKGPGGVAVDWIHNNVYWTDSGVKRIEVAPLEGSLRRVIVWENVEKPRAIAVHPGQAAIVWTDWGQQPRIERADMDGSNRFVLVTADVAWPNGLTIDYTVDRVYWADAKHHVIESVKLDGTGRRRVIDRGLPHPFAITIFEDFIFWTDWHTKSIHEANKLTGRDIRVVRSNLHFPMDIHSIHPLRQPAYVNRCGSNNGGCSHLCLPHRNGFTCACPAGLHLIEGGRICSKKPSELLIFAQKSELRLFPLNISGETDYVLPLTGIRSAVALDWDGASETIFWTDVESDVINRAFWNGSNQQTLIANDLQSPAGLAVDWVTGKLYWTDAGTNRIEVANLDGSMRSLLIWEGLDRPRDIVVDPVGGFMYWTDWGQTPKIERAGMDGTQRSVIVSSNLTWPNGLAIDHEGERLYWADGGTKAIEYATLDGKNRSILIGAELPHPFGLALYEDQIFWSDWDTSSIHSTDKLNAKRRTVVRFGLDELMDVRVYHSSRYSVPSLCHSHNGGCSHLCLLAPLPTGHSCACPTGIKLMNDGRTCEKRPSTSLIFSQRSTIRQMSLDMPYTIDVVLNLPLQKNAVAIDVDRKSGSLMWSDTTQHKIIRALPDGSSVTDIVTHNLDTVEGLAIDEIGRKLYWTDAGRRCIEVAELDGSNRKLLLWNGLDKPRGLVLNYAKGHMFWTDWGKQPRIEQADMDGKNRNTLISSNIGWPNCLAIDHTANTIYWTDANKKSIEACDLSGQNRREVLTGLSHPYGLAILDQHLYWTDWNTRSVQRADKFTGLDRTTIRSGLSNLMELKVWLDQEPLDTGNPCAIYNGGCSHLCLRSPWGRAYSCACPTGILMHEDGFNCQSSPNSYLLYATRNTLSRISLDTPELWDVALNIPVVHNAIGVDFHWVKQRFYYTDVYLGAIKSVDALNVSNVSTLVATNLTTPDGLAVDWLADNLYWADAGRNVLEVSRLDGSSRKIIISNRLDEPRAVAVFPQIGLLYWTDWGDPKIERSFLDGSDRQAIVTTELGWPNGLAIDYEGLRLYWADAQLDRIETADLSGRHRVQLVQGATHPFGLTQLGEFLYWTDWRSKSIERVDKATGKQRSVLRNKVEGLMEIRAVAKEKQDGKNPCSDLNGGCTHLCLYRAVAYVCACPDVPDSVPCVYNVTTVTLSNEYWKLNTNLSSILDVTNDFEGLENQDLEPKNGVLHPSIVVLLVVGLITVVIVMILFTFKWQRRRFQQCSWNSGQPRQAQVSVLTFANPNYSSSVPDVVGADKKTFSWQRWKYDRDQERVYDIQDEKQCHLEAASLIPHSTPPPEVEVEMETATEVIESSSTGPTPPPTPPERMDSICLQ